MRRASSCDRLHGHAAHALKALRAERNVDAVVNEVAVPVQTDMGGIRYRRLVPGPPALLAVPGAAICGLFHRSLRSACRRYGGTLPNGKDHCQYLSVKFHNI